MSTEAFPTGSDNQPPFKFDDAPTEEEVSISNSDLENALSRSAVSEFWPTAEAPDWPISNEDLASGLTDEQLNFFNSLAQEASKAARVDTTDVPLYTDTNLPRHEIDPDGTPDGNVDNPGVF